MEENKRNIRNKVTKLMNEKIKDFGGSLENKKYMLDDNEIKELKLRALELRKRIIYMVYKAKSGHIGGSLSSIDLLNYMYFQFLNTKKYLTKEKVESKERDRFIISKAHISPAVYSVFEKLDVITKEDIDTFRKLGSKLEGHVNRKSALGIDYSGGSLGQGLSYSVGIALAQKHDEKEANKKFGNVYCLVGDGELQEGQNWEAMMSAHKYNLNNLCLIVDRNRLQIDGNTEDVMALESLKDKLESFGFSVYVANGHDYQEMHNIFNTIKEKQDDNNKHSTNKSFAVILNTIKGSGVSYMENKASWHGVAPNEDEYNKAMEELDSQIKNLN